MVQGTNSTYLVIRNWMSVIVESKVAHYLQGYFFKVLVSEDLVSYVVNILTKQLENKHVLTRGKFITRNRPTN